MLSDPYLRSSLEVSKTFLGNWLSQSMPQSTSLIRFLYSGSLQPDCPRQSAHPYTPAHTKIFKTRCLIFAYSVSPIASSRNHKKRHWPISFSPSASRPALVLEQCYVSPQGTLSKTNCPTLLVFLFIWGWPHHIKPKVINKSILF